VISHFAGAIHHDLPIFSHTFTIFWDEDPHPWQRHVVAHYGGSFSQCGNLKWAIDKDLFSSAMNIMNIMV